MVAADSSIGSSAMLGTMLRRLLLMLLEASGLIAVVGRKKDEDDSIDSQTKTSQRLMKIGGIV